MTSLLNYSSIWKTLGCLTMKLSQRVTHPLSKQKQHISYFKKPEALTLVHSQIIDNFLVILKNNNKNKAANKNNNQDKPRCTKQEIPFADGEGTKLDQQIDKSNQKENESKSED